MTVTKSEKYVDIPAQVAQQGDDEWKSGRYDEARSHYLQAATLYEDNEDYHGAGQVMSRLGELELSLENFIDSEKALQSAINLVKNQPDSESIYAETLIKLSKLYSTQYDIEAALKAIKSAEKILTSGGSRQLLGEAYDQEAYICLLDGRNDKALEAYQKAAECFRQEGINLKEASVLRAMARLLMKNKDYAPAHDLLERSRELYREIGDVLGEASALSAIGCLRYIIGDIEQARKALMKAVYLYGKVSHHFAEAEALLYLARVESFNREQGDFARAKAHYKKSIELYDFMQNEAMKKAVLDEYENFLKREILD